MIWMLMISLGFLLAVRGSKEGALQRPAEGLSRIWREAADLLATIALIVTVEAWVSAAQGGALVTRDYAVLLPGLMAYLLARYQKKTDVFFLAATVVAFMVRSCQRDLAHGLSLAWAIAFGVAVFQTGLLGLRYRLLFVRMPTSVKGWPSLCLLAAFLALVLGAAAGMLF